MVIYDLTCSSGHHFEGWFPNAESFEDQIKNQLVACSVCGAEDVRKVPSGGHVSTSTIRSSTPKRKKTKGLDQDVIINVDPVILVKAMQQFVQTNFKDVGKDFAEKAIKMHKGDIPNEPIYGSATPKDQDRLEEEGVDYTLVPKLPEEFEN